MPSFTFSLYKKFGLLFVLGFIGFEVRYRGYFGSAYNFIILLLRVPGCVSLQLNWFGVFSHMNNVSCLTWAQWNFQDKTLLNCVAIIGNSNNLKDHSAKSKGN